MKMKFGLLILMGMLGTTKLIAQARLGKIR